MAELPIRTTARYNAEWISKFYVSMYSLAAISDPKLSNKENLLVIAENITEEKKTADELNKTNLDLKKAEKEMREVNNLWQSVLDNMPINIFLKEAENLSFSFVNKSFEELNDLPHGSMVGKSDYDYFPESQVEEFRIADRGVLDSKELKVIPEEMIKTSKF